jgi:hypothetical protein
MGPQSKEKELLLELEAIARAMVALQRERGIVLNAHVDQFGDVLRELDQQRAA